MSAETAATLRAAADVLENEGWVQNVYHARSGDKAICHCAEGAIAIAAGDHFDVQIAPDGAIEYDVAEAESDAYYRRNAAERALRTHVAVGHRSSIPRWNDAEGRTAAEVIAALRAAADKADQS